MNLKRLIGLLANKFMKNRKEAEQGEESRAEIIVSNLSYKISL